MTAVQFPAKRDCLEFFQHGAVGPACGAWEDRIVRSRICGTEFLEHRDELLRNRDLPLLPVLRVKSPVRFGGYANSHVLEIDIAPGDEAPFRVAKA